jgi:predicted DNA-binding transcriptional regulator AlpA
MSYDSENHSIEPLSAEHLLTTNEVKHRLGVSRSWVIDHANGRRRPILPSVKLGKCRRFEPAAVARFIEECRRIGEARSLGIETYQA